MDREPARPSAKITLCSVSFNSRPWLEVNWRLAHNRNPATPIDWLIAENSPPQAPLRLLHDESRFRVVPGAAFERRAYGSGSYHHGRGMNRTLPHIATRFALFCDPDFFIVRENWIHAVIQHMTEHGIGILGVPWHPRWTHKVRYFPCVHCMFVDLEVAPVETLDFTPDIDGMPGDGRTAGSTSSRRRLKLPDPLKLRRRRRIGTSRDVSWRIHDRYASDPGMRIECLQPVFRTRGWARGRLERLLPDRWSLLPQQADYFTTAGFKEHGLPDLDARGWEEFVWQDRPFGFHVRSQPKLKGQEFLADHLAEVQEVLRELTSQTAATV